MLDLDVLEACRREVCNHCSFYKKDKDACGVLQLKFNKVGRLSHQDGVRNPKARCPYHLDRQWQFIPSAWAWEIEFQIMPINEIEVLEYTRAHSLNSMTLVERAYAREDDLYTPPLRSVIVNKAKEISSEPNEYQFLQKYELEVNYLTGELTVL